jgi:hypothetical protein
MNLMADECVDRQIVERLRKEGLCGRDGSWHSR